MLFRMSRSGEEPQFSRFEKQSAAKLGLKEKDIENWLAHHPKLLFGTERVIVIGQSFPGLPMPDVLALDADGKLVLVEIKRDWSDRKTVGQLLDYAADESIRNYDTLNALYGKHRNEGDPANLLDRFRREFDKDYVQQDEILNECRLCIVAPASDDGLARIIRWLKSYAVPIDFIPFSLYSSSDTKERDILLDIEQLPKDDPQLEATVGGEWRGDWIFNTNETNKPGAYKKMFDQGVIAIYGYETGPDHLKGATAEQRVFAYVNGKGILAVGEVVDGSVKEGTSVFGKQREYHMEVKWRKNVKEDSGVTSADVRKKFDIGLPVRNTFCKLGSRRADWIEQQIRERERSNS